MFRYATWKPVAGEPSSMAVWILLALVNDAPRVMTATLGVVVSTALITIDVGLGIFFAPVRGIWSISPILRRAPRALARVSPMPSSDPPFPVRVEIRRNGVSTGLDDVMIVFVGGWLHADGLRMSFSLRAADVIHSTDGERHIIRLPETMVAELRPYRRIGTQKVLQEVFNNGIEEWRIRPTPQGESLYPPNAVHPRAYGQAVSAVIHATLLLGLTIVIVSIGGWIAFGISVVVGLCGGWRLFHALKALRLYRSA